MSGSSDADRAALRCVLGGAPGVGKSTVGRAAAAALGWRFVDVDADVEREAGATVAEVFAREGEAGFRAREAAALRRALDQERVVIAAGAGALVDPALRREVLGRARVLTLRAPLDALRARLGGGAGRPLLQGRPGALEALLEARRDVYAEAHAELDASGPVEAVAALVVACARSPLPRRAGEGGRGEDGQESSGNGASG